MRCTVNVARRFFTERELLENACRWVVARIGNGKHAWCADRLEGKPPQCVRRLGTEPATAMRRCDRIAEFDRCGTGEEEQRSLTDWVARLRRHGKSSIATFAPRRMREREIFDRALERPGLALGDIAHHERIGKELAKPDDVIVGERP